MPKKTGRPLKVIEWDKVNEMLNIQCTGEEIAAVLDMDYDTLSRACEREKGRSFADYSTEKRKGGLASLRRRQWLAAVEDKNPTMLIWLGKNMLKQTDKQEFLGNADRPLYFANTIPGLGTPIADAGPKDSTED